MVSKREIIRQAKELVKGAKEAFDAGQGELVDSGPNVGPYDDPYETVYLGSVLNIMPSGKFYMPWTSNQTEKDVEQDALFMETVEKEAGKLGMWMESGIGDGLDLFMGRYPPSERRSCRCPKPPRRVAPRRSCRCAPPRRR